MVIKWIQLIRFFLVKRFKCAYTSDTHKIWSH